MVPADDPRDETTLRSLFNYCSGWNDTLDFRFGTLEFGTVAAALGITAPDSGLIRIIRMTPKGVAIIDKEGLVVTSTWGQVFDDTGLD